MVIHGRPGPQARSYNRPRAAEIAVIIPDERSSDIAANPRDIVVRKRGGGLRPGLFGKLVRILLERFFYVVRLGLANVFIFISPAVLFSTHFLHIPCFHHISEFNVAFDPLHFVLMYPRGEAGWGLGIPKGILRDVPNAMPVVDQASHKCPSSFSSGQEVKKCARARKKERLTMTHRS